MATGIALLIMLAVALGIGALVGRLWQRFAIWASALGFVIAAGWLVSTVLR